MTQTYLERYDAMCDDAAAHVIARYSTSFTLATRLLSGGLRRDIRNLYAMVRIADEIVDGSAAEAGVDAPSLIDAYEDAVLAAPSVRFHTDPVLHAYAATARRCEFDPAHVRAFFASMRQDTARSTYDSAGFDSYVYGSAEVIGLLSLSAFLAENPATPADRQRMEAGARSLGSAFQKINFLRDFGEDYSALGRTYFPELRDRPLDDATKSAILADIRSELSHARSVIPLLPPAARGAVSAAEALFSELADRVDATPASRLKTTRVSVPRARKLILTARAFAASRKGPGLRTRP